MTSAGRGPLVAACLAGAVSGLLAGIAGGVWAERALSAQRGGAAGVAPRPPAVDAALLRAEIAAALAATPESAGAPPSAQPKPGGRPGDGTPGRPGAGREPAAAPEVLAGRLRALVERWSDEREFGERVVRDAERERWLLTVDRTVLEWFGSPQSISVGEGGVESWYYSVREPAGDRTVGVTLTFHEGRLIGMR